MKALKLFWMCILAIWLILACGGCAPDLSVENQNAPDTERALASDEDIEALIGGSYLDWWSATQKSNPGMALSVAADELTSSWGNFHMQNASSEPRIAFNNSPSYAYREFNETPWYNLYPAISSANDGLRAINKGTKIIDDAGNDNTPRAQAFAKFVQGLSHGFAALFFDRAFIYDETIDVNTTILDFKPYNEVMNAAIQQLEAAIAICNANAFTLPVTWINGLELSNAELAQLAHSYIARFLAQVARDPNARAAVAWNQVLSHANQGITKDFAPIGDGNFWWDRLKGLGQEPLWCRVDNNTLGLADTSGNYQAWLNTSLNSRQPFLVHTADRRITNGDPKGAGTDIKHAGTPRHRPDRGTYHFSFYQYYRYESHLKNDYTGPMPAFLVAELNLLKAEALFRLKQAGVADLINITRVNRGQLPPTSDSDPDLWKKLVYEKRIELITTAGGLAFFDARGWGTLISGTPMHWPVPGKELEILRQEIYTFGGVGGPGSVPKIAREFPYALLMPH